ncbi:hypothetical protein [Micromonospora sp. NPDC005305]|uniref:hypothetical protein n=1 Tax=Micromonospora sp. NPDC005305 TaxID=3156875 RepID=UPI0033AE219B
MSLHQQRRLKLVGALAGSALTVTTASLLPAAPAAAAPARADLVVATSVDPVEVPASGGWSDLTLDLRNSGTKASQAVTVAVTLPAGAWFPTDGFVIPASWNCDLLGTATCTHAPLAAGEVGDTLSIPFGLPAGTAGDTLTVTATAKTGVESSTANNTGQATMRYIPSTVDLDFEPAATTQQLLPGEQAQLITSVRNTGNSPSGDVTVTTPVPVGTRGWETFNEGWDCAFGDGVADGRTGWRCIHAPLRPGQTSEPLEFAATLTDVTVGQVVTIEATASTTSTETTLDNNTARDTVTVEQGAIVRGTVWVDSNRNGVRDAGEGGAPVGSGGIDHIELVPQTSGQPGYLVTVNPDGTYVAYARAGTYRLEFFVQDPHEFVDSVDSDLIYHWNETGGYNNYGYTDWFAVATGDEVTRDAGVN